MATFIGKTNLRRTAWVAGASVLAAGSVCLALYHPGAQNHRSIPPAGRAHLVYTSEGFGGYVGVQKPPALPPLSVDPLRPARDAYYVGRYTEAESAASAVQRMLGGKRDARSRKRVVQAEVILAYSAARRRDLVTARDRFSEVREMAAGLPDHGAQTVRIGDTPAPTLEEEGAFQHAVCVGALDGKAGQVAAEDEYVQFLKDYPTSILLRPVTMRIRRYHQGNLPDADELLFRADMKMQREHDRRQRIEAALCGPQCLSELLRRRGERVPVHVLAKELGTAVDGTSLKAMARVADRHGWQARGLELTETGLQAQTCPLLTLIRPGHYVLVDRVTPQGVTVWDPDGKGSGKPATHEYSLDAWKAQWKQVALALR